MKYKLGDIVKEIIDYRGKTPKKLGFDWSESGIRAFSAKNIKTGQIVQPESIRYISEENYPKWMKQEVERGTILITSEAPFGQIFYWNSDEKIVLSQRLFAIKIKDEFDSEFVYYQMTSDRFQSELKARATGSTVTGLRQPELMKCEIDLPDLETQKKIVRILSTLDQKIELNNQQSKLLETIAFTVYDDFINSINKSNSKKVTIGQIADCKLGGTPSRVRSEYWGGSINWINSGAINSFRITEPSELITEEGFKHTSTYMLPKGTTVLAITGATLGQVSRMEIEGCANQSVIGIIGNDAISNEYIYLTTVRNIQEIINRQTGGAQQHINKNDIKEFEILLPNQQLMSSFTNEAKPIFEKIAQNEFENKNLSLLRDTLLPKLMSDEIKLDKVKP